eukprot:3762103-Rhodomonas_salina.1
MLPCVSVRQRNRLKPPGVLMIPDRGFGDRVRPQWEHRNQPPRVRAYEVLLCAATRSLFNDKGSNLDPRRVYACRVFSSRMATYFWLMYYG